MATVRNGAHKRSQLDSVKIRRAQRAYKVKSVGLVVGVREFFDRPRRQSIPPTR